MTKQDLTSTVEALVARMSQMQAELDSLKGRTAVLPQPTILMKTPV